MKLIIYSTTPAAAQSLYDFTTDSKHEVVAFTDEKTNIKESKFLGLPVVLFDDIEKHYLTQEFGQPPLQPLLNDKMANVPFKIQI